MSLIKIATKLPPLVGMFYAQLKRQGLNSYHAVQEARKLATQEIQEIKPVVLKTKIKKIGLQKQPEQKSLFNLEDYTILKPKKGGNNEYY